MATHACRKPKIKRRIWPKCDVFRNIQRSYSYSAEFGYFTKVAHGLSLVQWWSASIQWAPHFAHYIYHPKN